MRRRSLFYWFLDLIFGHVGLGPLGTWALGTWTLGTWALGQLGLCALGPLGTYPSILGFSMAGCGRGLESILEITVDTGLLYRGGDCGGWAYFICFEVKINK